MTMKMFKGCLTVALVVFASLVAATPEVKLSKSGICHDKRSPSYERTKNFTSYDSLQDCVAAGGRPPKGQALPSAPEVKRSKAGICHDVSSPSYKRIKHFTPFKSMDTCLAAGGTLPKQNFSREEAEVSSTSEYQREYFGAGWGDMDGDCQNSRHEALIAQSTSQVVFKGEKECLVVSGRWISMFTGDVIHDAKSIDIDHVVPLKWAWDHGADTWSKERRVQFANDPANLLAVEASLNRQKGAKGPDEWLPPTNQCQYVSRFKRMALKYKLPTDSIPDCNDLD